MNPAHVQDLIQTLSVSVEQATARANANEQQDLAGFEKQVAELCEVVLALDDSYQMQFAEPFAELAKKLDVLRDSLARQRDSVQEELFSLSSHKQANKAYRTADATDNFGQRDKKENE